MFVYALKLLWRACLERLGSILIICLAVKPIPVNRNCVVFRSFSTRTEYNTLIIHNPKFLDKRRKSTNFESRLQIPSERLYHPKRIRHAKIYRPIKLLSSSWQLRKVTLAHTPPIISDYLTKTSDITSRESIKRIWKCKQAVQSKGLLIRTRSKSDQ